MKHKFYHSFHGDDVLKFISTLSVLDKNSRFGYRLMVAQMRAYIMWRRGKCDWKETEDILQNGIPELEDPQERLFIETVNTPRRSYRCFSTFYLTHKFSLSQLLMAMRRIGFPEGKLSVVYSLLNISDVIAERFGYPRYLIGSYDSETIYLSNYREFTKVKDNTSFTKQELDDILATNNLIIKDIYNLLLDFGEPDIEKEFDYQGYSDVFELRPILKLNNDEFLIPFPSALLKTAYVLCYTILRTEIGEQKLIDIIEEEMIQEVGAALQCSHEFCVKKCDFDNVPFLWFEFDKDKIANVAILLADKKQDIESATVDSETAIQRQYPEKKVFTFYVVQQIQEGVLFMSFSNPITCFGTEELKIVMSKDGMNLLNLYYYDEDKRHTSLAFGCQEIDTFAFYQNNKESFYCDDVSYTLYIEIGVALSLRAEYLCVKDEHIVFFKPNNTTVLVHHYADLPEQTPIYAPYMLIGGLYMLQLSDYELWIRLNVTMEYKMFCHEVVIAVFNWIYAAQRVKKISPLTGTTHIEIFICDVDEIEAKKANDYLIVFCIPKNITQSDPDTLEFRLVSAFINKLRNNGFATDNMTQDLVAQMMSETSGRFMVIRRVDWGNLLDMQDGISSCYYVNGRCCNSVLAEIADLLNIKGVERKYNYNESKQIMIKVSDYILSETQKILSNSDTAYLLKMLLQLHHAMIYWSNLTQKRNPLLSLAYAYVGASFDHQMEYANNYSEMNTLTLWLIEFMTLNDIQNKGEDLSFEDLDRLFALSHFSLEFGSYMDMLDGGIPGSELIILPNGRLVMPQHLFDRGNGYIERVRKLSMFHPELYGKLFDLMPRFQVNSESQQFLDAFKSEFGIDFPKYCKVINASIEYATMKGSPIMVMPESEFYEIVGKDIFDDNDVCEFKEHFVLQSSLQEKGLNFSNKWIQRFNRPVQVTARPWILYAGDMYYSTKTIYESLMIKSERLCNATIVAHTEKMKSFVSFVNNEKGREFTTNIRNYYESLGVEGLHIRSNVEIRPDSLLNASKHIGDIDILLISEGMKQIVCIDAKNYAEGRTTYELIQQDKKIIESLPHIMERDKWCKEHVKMFEAFSPEVDENYKVKSVYLTYNENAYNYFVHTDRPDLCFISAMDIIEDPMIVFNDNPAVEGNF